MPLELKKISHTAVHTKEWAEQRLGKITASQCGRLFSKESHNGIFTKGAITYLEELAHEIITQEQFQDEFFNKDTDFGNANEIDAIKYFSEITGLTVLRDDDSWNTHRLIINDEYTGCTPDALLVPDPSHLFDATETKINIRTLEVKSNRKKFIKFYKCQTPQDLYETEPLYYFQVLAQIAWTNSLIGYWACYNPNYKDKMRIIEFNRIEMSKEFERFNQTIHYAKKELTNLLAYLNSSIAT